MAIKAALQKAFNRRVAMKAQPPRVDANHKQEYLANWHKHKKFLPVSSGLVMYHDYRAGAIDKSNAKNNGVMYTGRSLAFDGSNDYVDLGSMDCFDGSFTVVHWFKTTDMTFRTIQNRGTGANGTVTGWQISSTDGTSWSNIIIDNGNGDSLNFGSTPYTQNDNSWHRLALVWNSNNGNGKLYIDNVKIGDGTNPSLIGADFNGLDVQIGRSNNGSQYFNGELSNVQIWDKAWTADDVAYDYANVQATPNDIANASSTLAIADNKSWLSADEGAGTTLYDGSSNDNNGTITGATWTTGVVGQPSPKEMITNGGFDTDDDWNWYSGTSWDSGTAKLNVISGAFTYITATSFNPWVQGKTYYITFDYKGNHPSKYFRVQSNTGDTGGLTTSITKTELTSDDWQTATFTWTANANDNTMAFVRETGNGDYTFYIDNISIKDVTNGIPQTGLMSYNIETIGGVDVLLRDTGTGIDARGNDITNVNNGYLALHGDGYVEVADDSSLDPSADVGMTMECWVKATETPTGYDVLMLSELSGERSHGLFIHPDKIHLSISNSTGSLVGTNYNKVLTLNDWYHITVVADTSDTTHKYYINGSIEQTSAVTNDSFYNVNQTLRIGDHNDTNQPFTGSIDEPRIYSRALTEAEVLQNYNAGKSKHRN